MATGLFTDNLSPTPWGMFDDDLDAHDAADRMVIFIKRGLGNDLQQLELDKKMIWWCFERSLMEYSRLINESQAKSKMAVLLGLNTEGSLEGYEMKYPRNNLSFFLRQSEGYSALAGLSGEYRSELGYVELETEKQMYDLKTELIGKNGVPIFSDDTVPDKSRIRIGTVYHFTPVFAYRFFNTTSAINYLNNEFSFESFTPETIFYVLPVYEDLLRMGQMQLSHRVRRSNYSYEIIGRELRIMPMPIQHHPKKLFIRVNILPSTFTSLDGDDSDDQEDGVSNLANVPFGVIKWKNIASHGRQWIREYTLAVARELLGLIRSKYKSGIPIGDRELQLNGEDLMQQGREDMDRLRTQLMELLEEMTNEKIAERQANEAEALRRIRQTIPIPPKGLLRMG